MADHDLDARLRADGHNWRSEYYSVPPLTAEHQPTVSGFSESRNAQVIPLVDPTGRARTSRKWLAVAAAVCVAVLVVALTALVGNGAEQRVATGTSGFAGYRWTLTRIVDKYGTLRVHNPALRLAFTRDGYLLGNDGCNSLQTRYQLDRGGFSFVTKATSTTLMGCRWLPGSRAGRIGAAINTMFYPSTPRPNNALRSQVLVRQNGSVLSLQASRSDITLVARRTGAQANLTDHSPVRTQTRPVHVKH